jgi:Na+-translocating ferredoxin:NAD+ oxidoreductase RnfD subunit
VLAYAVILVGAVWVLRSVRMVPMALSFLVPFGALVAVFAASGRTFIALWHPGPVTGASYWSDIVVSPELLIFVFFMMSDPQTAPRDDVGRMLYGGATAVVAAGLLYFQPTEFGIKLAILSSLTVTCALVPLVEHLRQRHRSGEGAPPAGRRWRARPWAAAALNPAVAAVLIIAVAAPTDTAALARNHQLVDIERGLTATKNPQ